MPVGEDLDFDVPRALQIALQQHAVVAEGRGGLAFRAFQGGGEIGRGGDDAHALAAAAGARLDEHGKADARGLRGEKIRVLIGAVIAGHGGHAGAVHQRLGLALAAHRADGLGRRADEDQPRRGTDLGEGGVFREKSIARVDGLRAASPRGLEDGVAAQVAVARGGGADAVGLVGHGDVQRAGIGVGKHRDRGDAEASRRADDAAGDLAAIGDQQFAEHRAHIRNTPKRVGGMRAFSAAESAERQHAARLSPGR